LYGLLKYPIWNVNILYANCFVESYKLARDRADEVIAMSDVTSGGEGTVEDGQKERRIINRPPVVYSPELRRSPRKLSNKPKSVLDSTPPVPVGLSNLTGNGLSYSENQVYSQASSMSC